MIDPHNLPKIAAITAIVAFGVYRRVRRNIGRQTLTAPRQYVRMAIFTVLCLFLAFAQPLHPAAVASIASGLIVGALIGWFALRHTEFETTPQGYFYTPHLYIGIAVTALFIGRLLYRMVLMYDAANQGTFGMGPMPGGSAPGTALTLGILFLTASYYIVYCTGLLRWLRRAQRLSGARLPAPAPDGAPSTTV
jgi:cytochrome b561